MEYVSKLRISSKSKTKKPLFDLSNLNTTNKALLEEINYLIIS